MKKTFHVLTYNLSWATQANKVMGSEADFVDQIKKHISAEVIMS